MRKTAIHLALFLGLLFVVGADRVVAATINVPADYPTIQLAINNAAPGDTIQVAPGLYLENITVDRRITLQGAGSGTNPLADTILSSPIPNQAVITVTAGGANASDRLVIRNLRVTGANGGLFGLGSGIFYNDPSAGFTTFDNVTSASNSGSGMTIGSLNATDIVIQNSSFLNNANAGLRISSNSNINGLKILNSHFDSNSAGVSAFNHVLTNFEIHNSTFNDNVGLEPFTGGYGLGLDGIRTLTGVTIDCSEFNRNKGTDVNPVNNISTGIYILAAPEAGFTPTYSSINITQSQMNDNPNQGLLIQSGPNTLMKDIALQCDAFERNGYGVVVLNGDTSGGGVINGLSVHNSNVAGNLDGGLYSDHATTIDATSNWWGDASGPGGDGPGTGDAVSNVGVGSVSFIPFLTAPSPCVSTCGAAISIIKKTNGTDNDIPMGPSVPVGSTVNWTYDVTNIGGSTLTNIVVTDDQGVAVSCPSTTLAVGQSMVCTASGTARAGQYTNIGTVTGKSPGGTNVTDSNPDNYFGFVLQPLLLTCPTGSGTVGVPYSSAVVASGGTPGYTFMISSGSLPPGLSLNTSTGAITGTPTAAGSFIFTVKVTDSKGVMAFSSCGAGCAGGNVTWNFSTPTGVLSNSKVYTVNGIPITAYGFTNAGAPRSLYGKNDGGIERGLGIAGTTNNEIDTYNFVQLDLSNLITSGATNVKMVVNSVQSGEKYNVYGSNTLGSIGTLLASNQTAGNTPFAIPGYPTYRYVSVRATYGDVLITSVNATLPSGCIITIAPAPFTPCTAAGTLSFSGNSATSGSAGNIRTFSLNSTNVHVSAFSRTRSSGAWNKAYVGAYSGGLGVTDTSEGDGSSNRHKVDNIGGRDNYVVFEFSQPVVLDRAFLDVVGADSDVSVWIGTKTDPYNNHQTLSDALLNGFSYEENSTADITPGSRWADLNMSQKSGNIVVIAALVTDGSPEDSFKISKLDLGCPPPPVCTASTFSFSNNTATSGTAGNTRTFVVNGVTVKASAFSRTDSNGAWATAYLGLYSGGLGVTDTSEGDGSNNRHKVDNIGGRNNYVLFEFSSPVVVDKAFLDIIGDDSDISVWVGTKPDPINNHLTLSDALLSSLGAREDNLTTSTASRWADINAGNVAGNVLVISALVGDTSPEDSFKISKLYTICK